jgi:ribosomal protein S18 acetylase RimI-like enzyme
MPGLDSDHPFEGPWAAAAKRGSGSTRLPLSIFVVCEDPADHDVLRRVREWAYRGTDTGLTLEASVTRVAPRDVPELGERTHHPALVVAPHRMSGTTQDRVRDTPALPTVRHGRTVDCDFPCASTVRTEWLVNTRDLLPALRKTVMSLQLRRRCTVRPLLTPSDFEAYFALRYDVWRELDYIPEHRLSERTRWEIDYADRTAFPIGAFADDQLVGCARLVMEFGKESPCVTLIQDLLMKGADPTLLRNFQYPRLLTHPFDLLQSFPAFHAYYRRLLVAGVGKAEISRVIVRPSQRRCGLGELLVDMLIAIARAHGIARLFLACAETNAPLYQRSNFNVLPDMRTEHFVNVNAPAIAMERTVRVSG